MVDANMADTRKGKVEKDRWPEISARYAGGESLASIARDFNCTAPAIRYIVGRQNGAQPVAVSKRRSSTVARGQLASAQPPVEARYEFGHGDARGSLRHGLVPDNVRARVTNDIAQFLVALEDDSAGASTKQVEVMREATDAVLRSVARVLIYLNRAESDYGSAVVGDEAPSRRRP
jgi:hypothetical protein